MKQGAPDHAASYAEQEMEIDCHQEEAPSEAKDRRKERVIGARVEKKPKLAEYQRAKI